ncbi:MAG: hypothetical protein LH630_07950 [Actinomycetia bacterium]|nr:hypothetical protein [Actinomycetes bacterium]
MSDLFPSPRGMPPGFEAAERSRLGRRADQEAAVLVGGHGHCAVDHEGEHAEHPYFAQLAIWQQ